VCPLISSGLISQRRNAVWLALKEPPTAADREWVVDALTTPERRHARTLEYLAKARSALQGAAAEVTAASPLIDRDRDVLAPKVAATVAAIRELREAMGDRPEPARRVRVRRGR
jgi:hypothetical protein